MNEARFSRLRFPAHDLTSGTPIDKDQRFSQLFRFPEFKDFINSNETHKERVIKYIIFLYDPESDFQTEFIDINERKDAAAVEAGFKRQKDEWPEDIHKIMNYENPRVVEMTLRFLKIFKNPLWTEIATLEHELDKYTTKRWTSDDSKARELMEFCNKVRKQLDEDRSEFFDGDKKLQAVIEMITPENAKRILKLDHVSSN